MRCPGLLVLASAMLMSAAARADSVYSVARQGSEAETASIAETTEVSPRVFRVESDISSPEGTRRMTETVDCRPGQERVTTPFEQVGIEIDAEPLRAELNQYNLWWAVCEGKYGRFRKGIEDIDEDLAAIRHPAG